MNNYSIAAAFLLASTVSGLAAAQPGMPTQAYKVYHQAAVEATQLADVAPYSSAATVAAMEAYVPEQRKAIFEMHKDMYENGKDLMDLNESIDGNSSTVVAKFCGPNGRMNDVKAILLLEAGMWKVDLVSYASGASPC